MIIKIPISAGELLDKITILELKAEKISDPVKKKAVGYELKKLKVEFNRLRDEYPGLTRKISALKRNLYTINTILWNTENKLRKLESKKKFGKEFVAAARTVYKLNDNRAQIKSEINKLVGSKIIEIKSYSKYQEEHQPK